MATNTVNPVGLSPPQREVSRPTSTSQSQVVTEVVSKPVPSVPEQGQSLPAAGQQLPSAQVSTPAHNREKLEEAVRELNAHVQNIQRDLQFSVEEDLGLGRAVVKVLDTETREVIRQIPSEEVLAIAKNIRKLLDEQNKPEGIFLEVQA